MANEGFIQAIRAGLKAYKALQVDLRFYKQEWPSADTVAFLAVVNSIGLADESRPFTNANQAWIVRALLALFQYALAQGQDKGNLLFQKIIEKLTDPSNITRNTLDLTVLPTNLLDVLTTELLTKVKGPIKDLNLFLANLTNRVQGTAEPGHR